MVVLLLTFYILKSLSFYLYLITAHKLQILDLIPLLPPF